MVTVVLSTASRKDQLLSKYYLSMKSNQEASLTNVNVPGYVEQRVK